MSTATSETVSARRHWVAQSTDDREQVIGMGTDLSDVDTVDRRISSLIERNRLIHDVECINLNPASNVMNPRAEAVLSAGLTTRASLGHPGDKYEMGLEAIEEIEVIAADLACQVFGASYAELRVGSGALSNLYAFMATCSPGDSIIVPPASIGGHVTHRSAGAAGLYGLTIHECPIDADTFSVDLVALASLVQAVKPKLITVGTSLNLLPHPVETICEIAHNVGAFVLYDAAHVCGLIAGRAWPNPLAQGVDIMTMSTYKSLGGPASGLILTNRADLAERLDAIAYPGLTANFDVAKTAALAITLLDWKQFGSAYAREMIACASLLSHNLADRGIPVYLPGGHHTLSHQLAVDARKWGGGHAAAMRLREANLLTCAIGLPIADATPGLRVGTPEIVRMGMTTTDMGELASLIADALTGDPTTVALRSTAMRRRFTKIHFVRA